MSRCFGNAANSDITAMKSMMTPPNHKPQIKSIDVLRIVRMVHHLPWHGFSTRANFFASIALGTG